MARDPETRPAVRPARRYPGWLVWLFALDRPTLVDRPQRWGIVPTFRFWNRLDTAKHQVPALLVGLGLIFGLYLLLVPLVGILGPALALTIMLPLFFVAGLLPLGLFERWLRKTIAARRQSSQRALKP
jgi:hypothetical protein